MTGFNFLIQFFLKRGRTRHQYFSIIITFTAWKSQNQWKETINLLKKSTYKSYDELPLFLNAEMVANVLGVSSTVCYEMMHAGKLPVLRIGSRLIVPKEKFLQWIEKNTSGGTAWIIITTTSATPSKIIFLYPMKSFLSDYPSGKLLSTPIWCTVKIGKPSSAIRATTPSDRRLAWAKKPLPNTSRNLRESNWSSPSRPESAQKTGELTMGICVTPSARYRTQLIIFTSVRGWIVKAFFHIRDKGTVHQFFSPLGREQATHSTGRGRIALAPSNAFAGRSPHPLQIYQHL